MQNNLNQNNLNNRIFSPNDHTTWRWEKDEVLKEIPIEEAEARQIRQIAPQLGGTVYQVLNTYPSRFLYNYIDPNLNNNPQLLARRAAVIMKGQANNRVCIRGPVSNAHSQIRNFFEGGNMVPPPQQATSIHKTIDSSFAAKEFYKGRKMLSTYEYCLDDSLVSLRQEDIITKDCLFNFFNRIIANTESEDHNYINIRPAPLIGVGAGNYIYEAYNYLRKVYDSLETRDDMAATRSTRELLKDVINIEQGIDSVPRAIRVRLSSEGYGSIIKYFLRIKEELRLRNQIDNWTPLRIIEFINYVCEMDNNPHGLEIETINQLLLTSNFIAALKRAFEVQIDPHSLSYGLQVASTVPDESFRATKLHDKITFILQAVSLVSAENSDSVNADCVSNILDLQEGAFALNLCRHFALNATILAEALHMAINAENDPTVTPETQAAYIGLIANTVKEWIYIWLAPDAAFLNRYFLKQVAQVTALAGFNVKQLVVNYVENYLNSTEEAKRSFNTCRVSGINARAIACFMRAHRDNELNNETLYNNINFAVDITEQNIQNVDAVLVNDFIDTGNGIPLHEVRMIGLTAYSVAQLMRVANSHKTRLLNFKLALKLMQNTSRITRGDSYRSTALHMNHYLGIIGNPENFRLSRKDQSRRPLLAGTFRRSLAQNIRQAQNVVQA